MLVGFADVDLLVVVVVAALLAVLFLLPIIGVLADVLLLEVLVFWFALLVALLLTDRRVVFVVPVVCERLAFVVLFTLLRVVFPELEAVVVLAERRLRVGW